MVNIRMDRSRGKSTRLTPPGLNPPHGEAKSVELALPPFGVVVISASV
jgi:hypothetical protein